MRLIFIFLFASALICRAEENAAGRWEGSVQIPDRQLPFVVDLTGSSNGHDWKGSITFPGLGIKGAPLSEISIKNNQVVFSIKNALADQHNGPAKFTAQLANDGKLAGNFVQGGNTATFWLEKTGPPQVESPPRSTPIAKEIEGEWKGEYELLGYPRKVTLNLHNHGEEGATAEFVIVGRKENKLPVDHVAQQGEFIAVDSHETGLSFEGRARGNEMEGTILQGPLEVPVMLLRTN
jgi:hypothetical protein